jgi:hypothetical protein
MQLNWGVPFMKPLRLLGLLLMIGLSFAMSAFAGQKDTSSKTKALNKEAQEWLEAANKGDATAQYILGNMYEIGLDVPQDYVEAVKWYRKSAEQGDYVGQCRLGHMYSNGRGVPQDYVEAHKWYNLAASRSAGKIALDGYRDDIATHMTPAQIAEAQKLAREWKPK